MRTAFLAHYYFRQQPGQYRGLPSTHESAACAGGVFVSGNQRPRGLGLATAITYCSNFRECNPFLKSNGALCAAGPVIPLPAVLIPQALAVAAEPR